MFDHLELTAVMTSIFGIEGTNRRVLRSDMSEQRTFTTHGSNMNRSFIV